MEKGSSFIKKKILIKRMNKVMKKEIVLCVVIVLSIITGDIFLQNHTNNSLNKINEKLSVLRSEIKETDNFDMKKIEEIDNEWEESFEVLTCYLEHEELEKIKTQLVIISAGMELNDKEYVFEEIDRAIYIINHIETKQKLKLDNIL